MGSLSEEGLAIKSGIKDVKDVISYSIVSIIQLIIGEYFQRRSNETCFCIMLLVVSPNGNETASTNETD